jgi:hypothetical protein
MFSRFANSRYTWIGAGLLLLLLLAFFGGRYSRPARVEVKEHTVFQDRIVEKIVNHDVVQTQAIHDVVEAKHVVTQIEWRTAPDGKQTVTETIRDQTKTSEETKDSRQSVSDTTASRTEDKKIEAIKTTVTTDARPNWLVGVQAGVNVPGAISGGLAGLTGTGIIKNGILGVSVDRRILGPLFLGAWGTTAGAGGISVRIEF